MHYTPEEQAAATIIASLIYPDWPSGPDLETDPEPLGLYSTAVSWCREPYEKATELMIKTGQLYDAPGDAATAWEGLRQMTGAATPYARIDPLIRDLGGAAVPTLPAPEPAKPKPARVKSTANPEYVLAEPGEMPESQLIIERLKTLGWSFRLNLCDETIEVNGQPLGDIVKAEIRTALRDIGLTKKLAAAEDAYYTFAKKNAYHPVRDYLDSLKWDGEDHIGALAAHFYSNDPAVEYKDGTKVALFYVYLYRWLIAAVAKAYTGSQNAMLVLDGNQGLGKSTVAHWLCPLPGYFLEGPINPSDKDNDVRLISQWIWEVSELDATTRKADQSALKSFITKEVVTVRKSYGHHDIKKPAMASLIGTINNTSGFLADESGSRRFMTCKLIHIDRAYQKLDVNQIWAQARQLYLDGESGRLLGEEAAMQTKVNEGYQVETVLTDWIDRAFAFDPEYDEPYSLADVISQLELDGIKLSGNEKSQTMELARVLVQKGANKVVVRIGKQTAKRWVGLQRKPR